jgi:hypothetical protein
MRFSIKGENILSLKLILQIRLFYFKSELKKEEFEDDLIETGRENIKGSFTKISFYRLDLHLKEITPYTS